MPLISFGSDNHAGVHPALLESFREDFPFAPSYEMDDESNQLKKYLKETWGCQESFLVFNGTAANVLSLGCALKSFESALCSDVSHLYVDECGAPEKIVGCKLIAVPHQNGKISVNTLTPHLIRKGDQHFSQARMVSITQPTELGTVYTLDEIKELKNFCSHHNLYLHIDGARLANAAHHLNCEFRDILELCDIASVGGTKNGLLFGELVVINNNALLHQGKFLRKQYLQLPSKTRFLARQFLLYLQKKLWKEIAAHQHNLATYLSKQLHSLGIKINYPVQSNAVFCCLQPKAIKSLRQKYFFYVWNEHTNECRLMTSFATTQEHVDSFICEIERAIQKEEP